MIIRDATTSAPATESEFYVKQQLDGCCVGAPRSSSPTASAVRDANVILALEDGVIVGRGTRDELIPRRRLYHNLARRHLEL